MEIILSSIASGGLLGAANQYACLLIVAITARFGLIEIAPQMAFMETIWFIIMVAVLWVITLAPAYSAMLSPGVGHAINAISNFISGFLVPLSSAVLSLAAMGVIVNMHPELQQMMESLRFLNEAGNIGPLGYFIAAGGAASATVLTGMKALAKPAISTGTGTTGTVSAPLFATFENLASVVLMGLAYLFARLDPWLLVALFVVIILLVILLVLYAVRQMKRLRIGLGKVLHMAQTEPKAGLAIIAEFFVWGSGWLAWKSWGRGSIMLFFLALWLVCFFLVQPLFVALFTWIPPLVPVMGFLSILLLIVIYAAIGFSSARALLREIEKKETFTKTAG